VAAARLALPLLRAALLLPHQEAARTTVTSICRTRPAKAPAVATITILLIPGKLKLLQE
jgi:hypothetical protein